MSFPKHYYCVTNYTNRFWIWSPQWRRPGLDPTLPPHCHSHQKAKLGWARERPFLWWSPDSMWTLDPPEALVTCGPTCSSKAKPLVLCPDWSFQSKPVQRNGRNLPLRSQPCCLGLIRTHSSSRCWMQTAHLIGRMGTCMLILSHCRYGILCCEIINRYY